MKTKTFTILMDNIGLFHNVVTRSTIKLLAEAIDRANSEGQMQAPVKPEIADIIKNIMQEGFDIAMGGNAFESEEWNKQWAEKKYDEAITKYTELICKQFSV